MRKTQTWSRSALIALPLSVLLPVAVALLQKRALAEGSGPGHRAEAMLAALSASASSRIADALPATPLSSSAGTPGPSAAAARGPAQDPLAEPMRSARTALERARDTAAVGDAARSHLLEAVALEWAETGRDLARAREQEVAASRLEVQIADVEGRLIRAQALLEQTVARRGRAQVSMEAASSARQTPPAVPATSGQPVPRHPAALRRKTP